MKSQFLKPLEDVSLSLSASSTVVVPDEKCVVGVSVDGMCLYAHMYRSGQSQLHRILPGLANGWCEVSVWWQFWVYAAYA